MTKEEKQFILTLLKKDKKRVFRILGWYYGTKIFYNFLTLCVILFFMGFILYGMYQDEKSFSNDQKQFLQNSNKSFKKQEKFLKKLHAAGFAFIRNFYDGRRQFAITWYSDEGHNKCFKQINYVHGKDDVYYYIKNTKKCKKYAKWLQEDFDSIKKQEDQDIKDEKEFNKSEEQDEKEFQKEWNDFLRTN